MPFQFLSPEIKRYVREKRWDRFHPIQVAAITRISTTRYHYILSSRTASGKTEAAFLPVISQLKPGPGIQVLYISPLIALINDQWERIEDLCRHMDITITRRHGEADRARKRKLLENPTGILLITPESLESLFVNSSQYLVPMFSRLQFIILDEIHGFLGTGRGKHLESLLHRLKRIAPAEVRFIALSATLGSFEEARGFFGDSRNTRILRDKSMKETEAEFRYYYTNDRRFPDEMVMDIYRSTQGKKSLIFPNSRAKVEELAVKLKKIAGNHKNEHHRYFSHHSSISRDLREYAERFAKQSRRYHYSIVCTSTLELGIDIGMTDLIVQVGTVFSVSSLVQRFGRSGRKETEKSKLLVYALNPWGLLQTLACLALYRQGFIEPAASLDYPIDILFHQILSVLKETSGMKKEDLIAWIHGNHAFTPIPPEDIDALILFMVESQYIEELRHEWILGLEGEKIVNSRFFYSVFKTGTEYEVVYGDEVIGCLTDTGHIRVEQTVYLAAGSWRIIEVDTKTKRLYVTETLDGSNPVFSGSTGHVHDRIREKMLEILSTDYPLESCDEKGREAIQGMREWFDRFPIVNPVNQRPVYVSAGRTEFYTFTGSRINKTLEQLFKKLLWTNIYFDESRSCFDLPLSLAELEKLLEDMRKILSGFETALDDIMADGVFDYSKWGEELPVRFKKKMLSIDYFDVEGTKTFLDNLELVPGD